MLQSLNKLLSLRIPFCEANYYQYRVRRNKFNHLTNKLKKSKNAVFKACRFSIFSKKNTIFKLPNRAGIWNLPLLSIGPVHFRFKGWWVLFFVFISFVIDHSASKQWRPRSDAALRHLIWVCTVCLCPIKRMQCLYGLKDYRRGKCT